MNSTPPAPQQPYKPGDVANGHVLSATGTWEPISQATATPVVQLPATQPPTKHTTRNVLITIGVIVLVLFGVGSVVSSVGDAGTTIPGAVSQGLGANDAAGDVVFSGPAADPDAIGITYLPVTVTNHSAKRSDYYVEIAANAPDGNRVELGTVLVMALDPGQSSIEEAMFFDNLPAGTIFKVIQVQRTASA